MVSYLIATRNRPHRVQRLLRDIARTHPAQGLNEIVVVDDASQQRLICPARLPNGVPLRSVWLTERAGWAGMNEAARLTDPRSEWLVFLRDDTCPVRGECAQWLGDWGPHVLAVAPDIFVDAHGKHPARRVTTSLPETLSPAAMAVRRDTFLRTGGFAGGLSGPGAVLDLCARLLPAHSSAGRADQPARIAFDPRWMVARRPGARRTRNQDSLARQLRDYAFVLASHAPEGARAEVLRCLQGVAVGPGKGARRALARVLHDARSLPLGGASREIWDRLTGVHEVRASLARAHALAPFRTASLIEPGRHAWVVAQALADLGVPTVERTEKPDVLVIASITPAAMLGALFRHTPKGVRARGPRVLAPWTPALPAHPGLRPAAAA